MTLPDPSTATTTAPKHLPPTPPIGARWRTTLVGTLMGLIMLALGSFVVLMSQHLAQEQAQEALERSLLRQAQDILKFRNFYTTEVMAPAQSSGVRVSHDFKDKPGTLPLPATMVIELGHFFNQEEKGSSTAYYSDMPFPWRALQRQLDGFQKDALVALRQNPDRPFIREEQRNGQTFVRLALADRMQEACVSCHNTYPQSPFTQWKLGDVRGALEVSMPILPTRTNTHQLINYTLGILTFVAMLGLFLFWRALRSADLHLQTAEGLAAKYQESNIALRAEVMQREAMEQGLRDSQKDLIEAKAKADSANELKSQFLANMSHEIRTPMNGVVGMTQMALQTSLDPQQLEYISLANVSAKHLMAVINDILDFSKIEAGHLSLQPIACSPWDVAVQTVRSFQREAQEKGLLLSIENDGSDPPSVMLDPVRLRQVLTNLIGNAIKFTAKGEVQVTMRALPNSLNTAVSLAFSVRDTGIGFATEQSTRLFDPFIQGDGSITRSFGGVLRQHILVVEDHAINLKLACLLLDRMGHTYQTAANGQEALQLLTEQAFDMVLLDVMMPVLDGMSTLKALRQWPNSPLTSMPVIMVTAHAMTGDRERFLAAGANGYVSKPIGFEALEQEIQRLARAKTQPPSI